MRNISPTLLAVLLAASLSVGCAGLMPAMVTPPPAKLTAGLLTDNKGITLYSYDRDVIHTGKSVCNGDCSKNWPPFMAALNAKPTGDFAIIKRDDGKTQWAYQGKPLYFWPEDQEPGDKYGNNYSNIWRAIGPASILPAGVSAAPKSSGY